MALPTHIMDYGSSNTWEGPGQTLFSFINTMRALDGDHRNMRVLCKLVRPAWSDELSPEELDRSNDRFVQVGGSADALTIEVRKGEGDEARVYTLGRLPADDESKRGEPEVVIKRGKAQTLVYPDEVFNADDAGEVFYHYYKHDEVPEKYQLREAIW